jgi:hypothetical protein
MNTDRFWDLIESARSAADDPSDSDQVATEASTLLATRPHDEIIAAEHAMFDLLGSSYRLSLWAAAYMINGGCSDDGFDYFRGWLILQGKDVFERVVADPDSLADLPVIREAAANGEDIDGEMVLSIAAEAMRANGSELPEDGFTMRHPEQDPAWDFDFDDQAEMARRLPRLSALYTA